MRIVWWRITFPYIKLLQIKFNLEFLIKIIHLIDFDWEQFRSHKLRCFGHETPKKNQIDLRGFALVHQKDGKRTGKGN